MNEQLKAVIEQRIRNTLATCLRWGANTAVELRHDKELIDYYEQRLDEAADHYANAEEASKVLYHRRVAELTGKIGGLQKQINRLEKENDKLRKAVK